MTQLLASLMHKGLVKLRRVTQDGMRLRAHAGTGKFIKPKLDEQLEEARAQIATLKAELESDTSASLDREQAAKMRAAAERQRKSRQRSTRCRRWRARTSARERSARNAVKKGKSFDGRSTSTTDPSSRDEDGRRWLPTCLQRAVRPTRSREIVGVAVTNGLGSKRDGADAGADRAADERATERVLGGGFANLEAITTMEQRGVSVYAPVRKQRSSEADSACAQAWRQRRGSALARADGDDDGAGDYKQRGSVAETINADQRHWRGMTRARLVGQTKVLAQTRMGVLLHNVLRAHALGA
ncbi:MAG: transposase [Sandaracinus sp.]